MTPRKGNATVVGASANVTTVGLAEREGVRVTFNQYGRFAAPIATLTVVISSLFLTAFVYLGGAQARVVAWGAAAVFVLLELVRRRGPAPTPTPGPARTRSP